MRKILLAEVPVQWRRRAAQHLESLREIPAFGAERARLGDDVTPIFRPDVPDVAYYEFEVILPAAPARTPGIAAETAGAATQPTLKSKDASPPPGFIIVATGSHDMPIPHFSFQRMAVSRELEAATKKANHRLERVVKIDSLCYVGEDESGTRVAQTGQIPPLLRGLPEEPAGTESTHASVVARPRIAVPDDAKATGVEHEIVKMGAPPPSTLGHAESRDWSDYKRQYPTSFGPLLARLKERAAGAWELQEKIAELGEGIFTGTTHRVALVGELDNFEIEGEGASLVEACLRKSPEAPAVVELHARARELARGVDFVLRLRYKDGSQETLLFFLVSRVTPTDAPGFTRRFTRVSSGEAASRTVSASVTRAEVRKGSGT